MTKVEERRVAGAEPVESGTAEEITVLESVLSPPTEAISISTLCGGFFEGLWWPAP